MKHIFVVDDEKNIRELIQKYLEKEGYLVTSFSDGQLLLSEIDMKNPDLLVLDIMLPGMDGLELCKEIRRKHDLPIIFVSARAEELDRILGIELGGDDYLTKPFSPRELLVRIRNIFKRIGKTIPKEQEIIAVRDVSLYPGRRMVKNAQGEIRFTTREYDLFEFLIVNRNISFTREHLIERIWGYAYAGETRMVDDMIKRIRKKLLENEAKLEITTVWGYGYRIDE